jgi:SPP1 family predicted phage head-tail adaptor
MSRDKARKYRHRVTIITTSFVDDGMGGNANSGKTDAPTDNATVWASVKPLSGDEYAKSDQLSSEVTHEIKMRYRALSPHQRLRYENKILEINRVININEMDKELKLLCTEVVE